ncbi:MAG: lysozyme [Enterobacterales bacterium endosymbiont of Blomia tropicalis]|uniref:lysozyme n=1 Tax=Mixta mediterraneensis TaxID=2758443 RepID=UPI0025A835FA|nr:lysozyme [Mixta mediterraneensis]MDL4916159.1 lysozyme [Mixta mediterraneensis]
MQISHNGLEIIKNFEDLKTSAYCCPAGIWTIGYGHTHNVSSGDICTSLQAETWLKEDCQVAEIVIETNVKVLLNQHQFDALVSFIFNVGAGNFVRSTLLKKLNVGDYVGAASEFGRWINAGGVPLDGLRKRRITERKLFLP